ncbi:MAG: tape measure protein, partial [Flammeovirgaceae bacterium]
DEFRSITEQAPLIAIALKEYLKVSTQELYKMFEDGKVKSKDLYDAIMTQGKKAEAIYNNLPISVERSFIRLQNTFGMAFLELDKTVGISKSIMLAFNGVSNTIEWMQKNWHSFKRTVLAVTTAVATLAVVLNM